MSDWLEFIAVMTAFLLSHALPTRPKMRAALARHLGPRGFQLSYSLLSLTLLYGLIVAAWRAPFVVLWDFVPWQTLVPNILMPFAVLLACCAIGAPNPLSFGGAHEEKFDPDHPGIAGIVRHPILWALLLWSGAHLVPNGDLAHVLLFGIFAVFSFTGMVLIDRRCQQKLGMTQWKSLARNTAFWPFGNGWRIPAVPYGRLLLALILYGTLLVLHPLIIGVSALPFGAI